MIASAHVVGGIVSGVVGSSARSNVSRFVVAFALGIALHVALDAIPHSDYGQLVGATRMSVVFVEVAATAALLWFMLRSHWRPAYLVPFVGGLAGSLLPDAKFAFALFPEPVATRVEHWGNGFHSWFHAGVTPFLAGKAAEVTSIVVLLAVLTLLLRRVS